MAKHRKAKAMPIPAALKNAPRWVCWKAVERNGKQTKMPVQTDGRPASTTDPATWTDYPAAATAAARFSGIGFVLGDGFAGVDLDNCLGEDGQPQPWAADIIARLDSYAETSPSGKGVKVFILGCPEDKGRRKAVESGEVEVYSTGRFFTVTGQHLPGTPEEPQHRPAQFQALAESIAPTPPETPPTPPPQPVQLQDQEILERMFTAKNGGTVKQLWHGGWKAAGYESQSQADAALCSHLAWWTGGDEARMDALFRQSGLYREKWERDDYRAATFKLALSGLTSYYDPDKKRPPPPNVDKETGEVLPDGKPMPPDPNAFPRTDAGNAELFAALHGQLIRYGHLQGRWLVFRTGLHWQDDADGHVRRLAVKTARARLRAAADLEDDKERKEAVKFAFQCENKGRLDAMLELAKSTHPVADPGTGWDEQPWLLGVANGVICLRTGELRRGRPQDKITKASPVAYDPEAQSPRWHKFLDEIFQQDDAVIEFAQRAAGYSLAGVAAEQVFFLLYGKGSNGKGVFVETLRHVLGPYAWDAGMTAFMDMGKTQPHEEALAELAGRRMVTASETKERLKLNEQRLKGLSHGDMMSARHMHKSRFEFQPVCTIWLSANHRPRVDDDSDGFWRSARMIPFLRQFLGEERDKMLAKKLKEEAEGILAWAVLGCLKWQRDGLGDAESVSKATLEWKGDADPLAEFVETRCLTGEGLEASGSALWGAYCDWCESERLPSRERITRAMFGRRMAERFTAKHLGTKANRRRGFAGVALLYEEEPEAAQKTSERRDFF